MNINNEDLKLLREQLRELFRNYDENQMQIYRYGNKLIPRKKDGSGIHIKKKNRGKFTESANKAGQSVQEHAKSVLNNPNATPLQKKRANFARNAAKWNK